MHLPRFIRSPLARLLRITPIRGRWRLAPLLNRLFTRDCVDVTLPDLGTVRLDLGDEDQLQIYWTGLHPDDWRIQRLIRRALPPDGILVDIGANIGLHTLAAARHVAAGGGAVLAFEPHPHNFATLKYHIAQNGHRHISAENLGLAEKADTLTCQGPARGGNWSLASRGEATFQVRLIRLDDYLQDHPLPRLDIMKIDVEGAEVRVLRGAERTLRRFLPLVIFEVCPAWLKRLGTTAAELFATLEGYGYTIHPLAENHVAWGPQLFSADLDDLGPGDWANLVAVPPESVLRPGADRLSAVAHG